MLPRMRTIRQIILNASPRRELCDMLGISTQFASDIACGVRVGGVLTLVGIADNLGLSDKELGASVREIAENAR